MLDSFTFVKGAVKDFIPSLLMYLLMMSQKYTIHDRLQIMIFLRAETQREISSVCEKVNLGLESLVAPRFLKNFHYYSNIHPTVYLDRHSTIAA